LRKEVVMKSIVTAVLVLVVEAGFVVGVAALPSPAEVASQRAAVAARHAPAAPAAPAARS
jgi:hypothetical protein